jgi:CHAT domain-containing protein
LNDARGRPQPARDASLRGLVVGNPVVADIASGSDEMFRLGFAPLPGADEEARRIAAMFPGRGATLLRGRDGGLAEVVREAPTRDVLHLASHGVARSDDPLASFVLLAPSACGELLTARRVMTLTLKADLVVLSACQTGLGRIAGDGVLGLSRAFLFAGATSVLVSHWSISDHATTALMAGFYSRYLGKGLDKASALKQSMDELRRQRGFEHPRYWAPFFLVGGD